LIVPSFVYKLEIILKNHMTSHVETDNIVERKSERDLAMFSIGIVKSNK